MTWVKIIRLRRESTFALENRQKPRKKETQALYGALLTCAPISVKLVAGKELPRKKRLLPEVTVHGT